MSWGKKNITQENYLFLVHLFFLNFPHLDFLLWKNAPNCGAITLEAIGNLACPSKLKVIYSRITTLHYLISRFFSNVPLYSGSVLNLKTNIDIFVRLTQLIGTKTIDNIYKIKSLNFEKKNQHKQPIICTMILLTTSTTHVVFL